jgi:hypothetical protein
VVKDGEGNLGIIFWNVVLDSWGIVFKEQFDNVIVGIVI